jgi:hypothetical protein
MRDLLNLSNRDIRKCKKIYAIILALYRRAVNVNIIA